MPPLLTTKTADCERRRKGALLLARALASAELTMLARHRDRLSQSVAAAACLYYEPVFRRFNARAGVYQLFSPNARHTKRARACAYAGGAKPRARCSMIYGAVIADL